MTTAKHQILIVGGGTAGITVAARLLRKGHADVAVIEPSSTHYYQPLWTLVGGGQAKASTTDASRSLGDAQGCHLDQERPPRPSTRTTTRSPAPTGRPTSTTCSWSVPGIQLDWNRTEGLADALGRDGVSSNYRFDLAPRTWDFIRDTRSGTAVFMMPSGPIKCAGAPQKIAYLASRLLAKAGRAQRHRRPPRRADTAAVRHPGDRRQPRCGSSPTTASPCTPTPR